jgi:hypothetical protein
MAQDQPLNTDYTELDWPGISRSGRPTRNSPRSKRNRSVADSCRLEAAVAEALFDVHRLEAIVEDLAVVVARVGRVSGGIGDVEDRLDRLGQTFGK